MKKILVIHPNDPSTTFLKVIYENMENVTLVDGGVTRKELNELIKSHDQVMMMGHGSPGGLFAVGNFPDMIGGYLIDNKTVYLLNEKDNSIFIWCNADQFVNRYKLRGFYTGMFISEVGEAIYCGLPQTEQDQVDESNYGFVEILSQSITESVDKIHTQVSEKYKIIAETNPVALYNFNRLYLR